jgi:transcriptional regulator with XRE-family HTH domain
MTLMFVRGGCVGQAKMGYYPDMGLREQAEAHFGMKVRAERDRRGWSQDELAKRLTEKGIPVYASTIAKIESEKKPRAVRLAEASAIADVFEVSLDRLLGRSVGRRQDLAYTLRALLDTAELASSQITATHAALLERAGELGSFAFPGRDSIVDRCEQAADALARASVALDQVLRLPGQDGAVHDARIGQLLEKLIDSMPLVDGDE